ncbi:hypothetical protein XENORESO_014313 [Xenotaenia resolanae]|uniref:Uncharacterized protein n=1 Tax=Xenotaenia resolanae TaxID=208358 RepID=A0ABV0X6B7_9TELE
MILTHLQIGTLVQSQRGSPHLEVTTNTPKLSKTIAHPKCKTCIFFYRLHTDSAEIIAHCRAKKILSSKTDKRIHFALHCLFLIHPWSHHWNRQPLPSVFTRQEKRRDLFRYFQEVKLHSKVLK